jgi:glycerol uptake operon antiterminator
MLTKALNSPAEIIFDLKVSLLEIEESIKRVHMAGKKIFIHIDLADGIGKDKTGVEYLAKCGVDGIISTRGQLIRYANDLGLTTVQRFFALDSKGVESIGEMLESANPDLIEIMPGIASKVIKRFVATGIPVIAGGLIETKQEITEALKNGAEAISTGKEQLWYI